MAHERDMAPQPMRRGRRLTPEQVVTNAILAHLSASGYLQLTAKSAQLAAEALDSDGRLRGVFWRNSVGAATNASGRLCRFGVPGMPDIWLVHRTHDNSRSERSPIVKVVGWDAELVGIEVKAGRGRPSPAQRHMARVLAAVGVLYFVAYSVSDVEAFLAHLPYIPKV